MLVEITHDEREVLLRLLDREFRELGPEIRHTESTDYYDRLRNYRKQIALLKDRLAENMVETVR